MRSRGDGSSQSTADPSAALARLYRQIESGKHVEAGFDLRDLDRMGVLNKEKTAVRDSYARGQFRGRNTYLTCGLGPVFGFATAHK